MAHISKLRFYSDAGLGITEEIKDQIAFDENQEQLVSKILQVRKKKSIWEFQVAWEDFDSRLGKIQRGYILMYLTQMFAERNLLRFLIFKNEPQVY